MPRRTGRGWDVLLNFSPKQSSHQSFPLGCYHPIFPRSFVVSFRLFWLVPSLDALGAQRPRISVHPNPTLRLARHEGGRSKQCSGKMSHTAVRNCLLVPAEASSQSPGLLAAMACPCTLHPVLRPTRATRHVPRIVPLQEGGAANMARHRTPSGAQLVVCKVPGCRSPPLPPLPPPSSPPWFSRSPSSGPAPAAAKGPCSGPAAQRAACSAGLSQAIPPCPPGSLRQALRLHL